MSEHNLTDSDEPSNEGFETITSKSEKLTKEEQEQAQLTQQTLDFKYTDICDVFLDMKQWCDEQCVYLLDKCEAEDFVHMVSHPRFNAP